MKLRSLFVASAAALLLTGAFVPRANADTLIVYFNFEDATTGGVFDPVADTIAAGNPGGGIQASTLKLTNGAGTTPATDTAPFGGDFSSQGGLLLNRTALDSDPAAPVPPSFNGQALQMDKTKGNDAGLSFNVDTSFLTNLSLTFATDNNGNGFDSVQLQASINGGTFFNIGSVQALVTGVTIHTFTIGTGGGVFLGSGTLQNTVFRLEFTGGASNGNDRQTVIDNFQLGGTVVPEPATVAGGLLCVFGLCWHQLRCPVRSPRLRRA